MSKGRNKRRAARMAANHIQPTGSNKVERSNQNQNLRMVTNVQRSEAFSGPLPHPDHLERYGQIVPNGAERIFKMAETQMEHRMNIENNLVRSDIRRSDFGLLYGFVIALAVTGSGTYITIQDKSIVGFVTMIAPLVSIIGLFIYNRNSRPQDDKDTSLPKGKKK